MAWLMLITAGLLETVFAVALKESDGFSRTLPVVVFLVAAAASFSLLSLALRDLPVGTAYAVWTGIGAAGTVVFGMLFLGEPAELLRIGALGLIVTGVIGLQLAASH